MPKKRAQTGRVSNRSAPKDHDRAEQGGRGAQGTPVHRSSTHGERIDLQDPTSEPHVPQKISGDRDKRNSDEGQPERSGTRNSQNALKALGNDAIAPGGLRSLKSSTTSPANGAESFTRTRRDRGQNERGPYRTVSESDPRGQSPIYVGHTPPPATLSKEARSSAAVGGRVNRNDRSKVARDTSQQLQENLERAKVSRSRTEAFKKLPEPIASFVVKVAADDGVGCADFLNKSPDTVNKPVVASVLRQAAIASIGAEDTYFADSCVNALAVISFCLSSTRKQATKLFTTMLLKDDDEIIEKFKGIVKDEKQLCLAQSARHHNSGQNTELAPHGGQTSGNQSSRKRKEEGNEFEYLHKQPRVTPQLDVQDIIREKFQKRQPAFFQAGSMFATVEHEVIPEVVFAGLPGLRTTSQSRHEVISKILYYVSVKDEENYCLALQAKTYGGLGLSKKANISSAIESHAIIYNTMPRSQPGEPKLRKQAVKVHLATGVPDLDPALRLDFGRVYTVEYTAHAQAVGEVAEKDQLIASWTEQMAGQ